MNPSLRFLFGMLVTLAVSPNLMLAQVNSGSDGSDGDLTPGAGNLVINMANRPNGIYHYRQVNIPADTTVTFIPNANNTPVVWLVQTKCVIKGVIDVSATNLSSGVSSTAGLFGGPGGYRGGNGGTTASSGQGPGGGNPSDNGGNASFGTVGERFPGTHLQGVSGPDYGNVFLMPLLGGSGGGGATRIWNGGGGGGGGAILIAASQEIELTGTIDARGADGSTGFYDSPSGGYAGAGGGGSGGSVRLVTSLLTGTGGILGEGGHTRFGTSVGTFNVNSAGQGRVRLDALDNNFGGTIRGAMTQGFQPIIIPIAGQGIQLTIASVAGVAVTSSSGALATPDVIVPAQQSNPIPIVVRCSNVPLNTEITVEVKPASGATVRSVGLNNQGTQASSMATVNINMPRGGGIIYAKAVTGFATAALGNGENVRNLAQTGWTADGERFAKMEITAALGGEQQVAYITESGKRYSIPGK